MKFTRGTTRVIEVSCIEFHNNSST